MSTVLIRDCFSQMEHEARRHPELSPKELQVLQLAADGETCASSGERMGLCEGTVKHIRNRAALKLGADATTHAVAQALRRGLIQ